MPLPANLPQIPKDELLSKEARAITVVLPFEIYTLLEREAKRNESGVATRCRLALKEWFFAKTGIQL